jgi:hypothetical protein
LVEEGEVVMAEVSGDVRRDDGDVLRMAMAEVVVMRDGLICERRASSSRWSRTTSSKVGPPADPMR